MANTFDFTKLPRELKMFIFHSFLNLEELTQCSLVCKQWRDLLNDQHMWKLKFLRDSSNWNCIESIKQITAIGEQNQQKEQDGKSSFSSLFNSIFDFLSFAPSS
jgi:hypothetical protein